MAYQTHAYVKREDEMKYARRVALWIIEQASDGRYFMDVAIINQSECPIYDIYVIGCPYDKDETGKKSYKGYDQCDVFPPNANGEDKMYMTVEVLGTSKNLASVTASMFFRDVNGTEWCRDSHGRLCKSPGYLKFFGKGSNKS